MWTSGLDQNWTNNGKLENEGFDVTLGIKVLALKDFSWELGASAGHYKNKVTALPDNDRTVETNIYGATIQTKVGQRFPMKTLLPSMSSFMSPAVTVFCSWRERTWFF